MTLPPTSPDSGPDPADVPEPSDPPEISADDELVSASLDGETTAAEEARLAADPALAARRQELAAVRAAVAGPPTRPPAAEREAAIGAALDAATVVALASRHRAASRWSGRLPLGLAAVVLLLLGVLGVVALNRSGSSSDSRSSSAATAGANAAGDASSESAPAAIAGSGTTVAAATRTTPAPSAAAPVTPTTAAATAPATTATASSAAPTTAPVDTTIASGLPDAPADNGDEGTSPPVSDAPGPNELVDLGAVDDEIAIRNASVGLLPRPPAEVGVACPAPIPSAGAAARLTWQGTPAVLFLSLGNEGSDDTAIIVADGSCAVLATISLAP